MSNDIEKSNLKENLKIFIERCLEYRNKYNQEKIPSTENTINSDLKGDYNNTKYQASFGTGNLGKTFWLCFVAYNQEITMGIYPVIFFNAVDSDKKIIAYNNLEILYGVGNNNKSLGWGNKTFGLEKTQSSYYTNSFKKKAFTINNIEDFEKNKDEIIASLDEVIEDFHEHFKDYDNLKNKDTWEKMILKYAKIICAEKKDNVFTTKEIKQNFGKELQKKYPDNNDIVGTTSDILKSVLEKKGFVEHIDRGTYKLLNFNRDELDSEINQEMSAKIMNSNFRPPLNQILYGPPGTGKTYNTIVEAVKIIEGKDFIKYDNENVINYKAIKDRFDELKSEGRIEFITFHQSYSYEDFVEGIRPNLESKKIEYQKHEGIFKKICNKAKVFDLKEYLKNKSVWKISLGNTAKEEDNYIRDDCFKNNYIAVGEGNNEAYINSLRSMKKGDVVFVLYGKRKIQAIALVVGEFEEKQELEHGYKWVRKVDYIYKNEALKNEKLITVNDIFLDGRKELDYKTLWSLDSYKSQFNYDKLNKIISKGNYVLIIDEINRGNISKIFGELITLIEPDKRLGNEHQITVNLPYGDEDDAPFGIPKNLYIIGTMNTSDRSIASVDIALRRRFSFKEMMPNSKLVPEKVGDIELRKLFETINKKISILLDRDHQIGHSYFMDINKDNDIDKKIDNLKDVWFDKVMPLLNEYFFNEWEKLKEIIPEFVGEIKNDILNDKNLVFDKKFNFKTRELFEKGDDFIRALERCYPNGNEKEKTEDSESSGLDQS